VTSPQRLLVDQLIAWIQAEVADSDSWHFHKEMPPDYNPGTNCAIFWAGDDVFEQDSTTGWLGLVDSYLIRYWEPADEGTRTTTDEASGDTLSDALQQVRRTVILHQGLPAASLANASQMAYGGSRKLGAADGASGVRGFEMTVAVRRPESYA
jgi:hypothetical protein